MRGSKHKLILLSDPIVSFPGLCHVSIELRLVFIGVRALHRESCFQTEDNEFSDSVGVQSLKPGKERHSGGGRESLKTVLIVQVSYFKPHLGK